jgi:glycosyltransferase involved in cell wall biosynthesis
MKILLINKHIFPRGGDAICTIETGKLLKSKGHEVVFWGMDHPENPDYPFKETFIPYIDYKSDNNILNKIKDSFNILYSIKAKKNISKLLLKFKPDIVHLNNFAHQVSPSILDVLYSHSIPMVMTMHDYKLICPVYTLLSHGKVCECCRNGKYYNCLLKKCSKESVTKSAVNTIEMYLHHTILNIYNKISVFIAPSQFMMSKVRELGFTKNVVHLYNFIDTKNETHRSSFLTEDKYIIYVGRLSEEKGLLTLLSAIKETQIKLRLIGEGPLRGELEYKMQMEKINNVELLGQMTGEGLRNQIMGCMFSVIPSECNENNPRSVIESFAYGKPVIGSRIAGIPEIVIDNETGFTYEPWNSKDLQGKILFLYNNPELAISLGKSARKLVEMEFDQEAHYNKLIQIYEIAMKKK